MSNPLSPVEEEILRRKQTLIDWRDLSPAGSRQYNMYQMRIVGCNHELAMFYMVRSLISAIGSVRTFSESLKQIQDRHTKGAPRPEGEQHA